MNKFTLCLLLITFILCSALDNKGVVGEYAPTFPEGNPTGLLTSQYAYDSGHALETDNLALYFVEIKPAEPVGYSEPERRDLDYAP